MAHARNWPLLFIFTCSQPAATSPFGAAYRAVVCVQGPAYRRRSLSVPASCGIACAKANHTRNGPIDRVGLSQGHTLRRSARAGMSLYERRPGSECGPRRTGNERDNPACPCGIVRFMFSTVKGLRLLEDSPFHGGNDFVPITTKNHHAAPGAFRGV